MAERTYRWLFWLLAIAGLLLDQGGKYGVYGWLYPPHEQRFVIVPGVFRLETSFSGEAPSAGVTAPLQNLFGLVNNPPPALNKGALFGLGGDHGDTANNVFAVVSVVAAAGIVYWTTRRTAARDWALCLSLGLILAGTLGNLYDRVVFGGVRDYLHFVIERGEDVKPVFDWPVFNIADSCLVCGAILLLLQAFFSKPEKAEKQAVATAQAAPAQQTAPAPESKA